MLTDTFAQICQIEGRSRDALGAIREASFAPAGKKSLDVTFPMRDVERMVGRTGAAIRRAEKENRVPPPKHMRDGRRLGYTLEEINRLRDLFGTQPGRAATDDPMVLAVQHVKGGVGKSTLTCNLAQYLGLAGYSVLVIDADPQGTTTAVFGRSPDYDVAVEETLFPFLMGDIRTLEPIISKTYFPGIDLIPAQLGLNSADSQLAYQMVKDRAAVLDELRAGIMEAASDYDIILMDPAPALGTIPLQVMRAANALLCPIRPSTLDFAASANFFAMLRESVESLEAVGLGPVYNWIRVVANDVQSKKAHIGSRRTIRDANGKVLREERSEGLVDMMRAIYGDAMLQTVVRDSAEIDNAATGFSTIFEMPEAITSRDVRRRALANMRAMCREVELLARRHWPSHLEALKEEGLA